MKIDLTKKDAYTLAELHGPIDDDVRGAFDESLHPVIGEPGGRLLIDISDCQRINSVGIAHLVALVARANTKASRVVFVAPSPFVEAILSATKLDTYFEVAKTEGEGADCLKVWKE